MLTFFNVVLDYSMYLQKYIEEVDNSLGTLATQSWNFASKKYPKNMWIKVR